MSDAMSIQSKTQGDGKPLVLLHAFPMSHVIWNPFVYPGFRTIAADFPGFGMSPLAPEGWTFDQAAVGLKSHLDAIGITEPVVLGGISMGGYWAMEFLRQYPERVSKLVLVSTRSRLDSPERKAKRYEVADRVLKEGMGWYVQPMLETLLGSTSLKTRPHVVEWTRKQVMAADPKAVAAAQKAMAERIDQTGTLRECQIPSKWFMGLEDSTLTFAEVKDMALGTRNSGLETFAKCGHLIPVEMMHPLATAMYNFVK